MTKPMQIPLDLSFRPALSGDDFFVAPANRAAVDWIDRWPDWPGPGLVIHGDSGSGKSHLAQVFAAQSGARILTQTELSAPEIALAADAPAYAIDDADALIANDPVATETLFHLFNRARSAAKKLLLTGRRPAARWPVALPDLASRLKTLDQVLIDAPDDALLGVLLVKQFSDRQLTVEPDVIAYLTTRMERSTAVVVEIVDALDRESLSRKRSITVPLARVVLDNLAACGRASIDT